MSRILADVAIAASSSLALSLIAKATFVSAGALIAAYLARRSRASVRHILLATAFVVLLALPVATVVVPPRDVSLRVTRPGSGAAVLVMPERAFPVSPSADSETSQGCCRLPFCRRPWRHSSLCGSSVRRVYSGPRLGD